jgi:hypothetical protein
MGELSGAAAAAATAADCCDIVRTREMRGEAEGIACASELEKRELPWRDPWEEDEPVDMNFAPRWRRGVFWSCAAARALACRNKRGTLPPVGTTY